jgi:hypothetical protein
LSSKKLTILVFGSLAVLSIIVNITIIALNGGFDNPARSLQIPGTQDLWSAGIKIQDGDEFLYNLTIENGNNNFDNYLIKILFRDSQNYWNTEFTISNESKSTKIASLLSKSNLLMKDKQLQNQKYIEIVESSILQIKDITREPKYLVIGAKWDSINTGITNIPIKITSTQYLFTKVGKLETFVLSYKIGDHNSKIWVSKDLPLPVKALIYNVDGKLKYKYDIISINREIEETI